MSREVRLLPNVRLKERKRKKKKAVGLRRRAGDGIKHKPTHTNTQSSGGMWCHFTHSAMSVNQFITFFFFYQSLQATVCVISVQSAWIRIMLAFSFCSGCSEREKQEGRKREKRGGKKKEHCCRLTVVQLLFLPTAN